MAAKMGGEPWMLSVPLKDLMVMGYDSFHDTANARKSVGAIVSTTNDKLTRFVSIAAVHENNDELLSNMTVGVKKSIEA